MIVASLSEMVSVGAVLPFLGVLTAPEQVYQHQLFQPLIQFMGLEEPKQLVFPLTILFIVAALFAGIIRLLLLYVITRFSHAAGADLSINIYRRTLYQEYSVHIARNSSEVINGVINKTGVVIGGVLIPTLTLISSSIILVGVMGALFVIDIKAALTASFGFGVLYWGVILYTKNQLKENSKLIAEQSTQMVKSLQEGLGGIRDVLIDGSQQFYCDLYRKADLPLRHATGNNMFISGSPRYVLEAIGMVLIAGLAYIMTQQENSITTAIPVLGALALGAQRVLPALQQLYSAYSSIKGVRSSFQDVLTLLEQPLPDYVDKPLLTSIPFRKEIQLKKINFRYTKTSHRILKDINLTITKGMRVGIIGVTGSGKSTLIDLIMGLLAPTDGEILIDNKLITTKNRRAWQRHIAHVPQSIYLTDSSIEENIAFGVPNDKINHKKVEKAAKQAQISKLIEGWQDGYKTYVGEQGIRLSGGQRQRIGIARALYKDSDVLIFDEATSALDNETEQAVMDAITCLGKDLTIFIIAHRLTTLIGCDKIIKLHESRVVEDEDHQQI